MNILNKGRCSRCIASKKESREDKKEGSLALFTLWLKCTIKNNWCRNCGLNCKEMPMGISVEDYKKFFEVEDIKQNDFIDGDKI
jgi:hypothetical protein